jgi:crossover junction endodeoxyribonuclease RuvC
MGIDPGTASTGFGIIEQTSSGLRKLTHGCVRTDPTDNPQKRLQSIFFSLGEVMDAHRPDMVCIELLFFNRNVTTAISVGQARGVALLACAMRELPVSEFTPLQVKQAVTGYGRATKHQVQAMVKAMLSLDAEPRPDDAADALAIAICCAHHSNPRLAFAEGKSS